MINNRLKAQIMLKQSFLLLYRRLLREPVFFAITLANLAIGFATFILISQFISSMVGWDRHNEKYNRVYRLQLFMDQPENVIKHTGSVTAALSRHELTSFPEVEKVALLHDVGDNNKTGVFLSPDKKNQFLTRFGYYADPEIFDILSFVFLKGDRVSALREPMSIVLSESLAKRLFPDGDAFGKAVYGENKALFTVTGIYRDIPEQSTWIPEYLIPMQSFATLSGWTDYEENYWAYSFMTYVLLHEGADPLQVDAKLYDALKNYRKEHHPYLRPLAALRLNAYFDKGMVVVLGLFSFVALLILVLSSINYINLQTANASARFREIGIRKAVGFTKRQLYTQFLTESVFVALASWLMGVMISQAAIPWFNRLLDSSIITSAQQSFRIQALTVGVAALAGILSGIRPAHIISSFDPVHALRQKQAEERHRGISPKKILITIQFSISVFLLINSFIVFRQTHYMMNRDLGFESNRILFSNIVTDKTGSFEPIRQSLLNSDAIEEACFSDYIPYILPGGNDISWEGATADEKVFIRISNVNYDFMNTYGIKVVDGRDFSRLHAADRNACLINETARRIFGWEDPVGRSIRIYGTKSYTVVGVVSDYVAFSVHNAIEPHVYRLIPDSISNDKVYSVRFRSGAEKEAQQVVQQVFEQHFPDDAYSFRNISTLIDNENAMKAWKSFRNVNVLFAWISVLISSIGLFGLVLFYTRRRLKEIGIRKVLGFTGTYLYMKLSAEFLWLVVLSLFISWPAAFYVYKVLPGADKYPLQPTEFLLATAIILVVAQATMSYQLARAIRTRPAEILKDE